MLILASGSPRRRQLLGGLQVPFEVVPSGADERDPQSHEDPAHYVLELARLKAGAVAAGRPNDVVIAADTDVAIDGEILGKPRHEADALRMLQSLRGRVHTVTTGIVVCCGSEERSGFVTSRVRMREFDDDEARRYIATGEPMDKAGAYAVQEFGGSFVRSVEGCYNAVVGLPLCLLSSLLAQCGVELPVDPVCRHAAR